MPFILILDKDAFMKNPIGVKWNIPAYVFHHYDLFSRNSTYLSRALC